MSEFRYIHKQSNYMKLPILMSLCLFPALASMVSCREKGPAERAGENMDKAMENIKDAVNPKGPAEKTGEKIDKAINR